MNDQDYLKAQATVFRLAHEITEVDWSAMLQRIEHSETLGPMLDPTLYRNAQKNLRTVRRLAEGARDFRRVVLAVSNDSFADFSGIPLDKFRLSDQAGKRLPGGA